MRLHMLFKIHNKYTDPDIFKLWVNRWRTTNRLKSSALFCAVQQIHRKKTGEMSSQLFNKTHSSRANCSVRSHTPARRLLLVLLSNETYLYLRVRVIVTSLNPSRWIILNVRAVVCLWSTNNCQYQGFISSIYFVNSDAFDLELRKQILKICFLLVYLVCTNLQTHNGVLLFCYR